MNSLVSPPTSPVPCHASTFKQPPNMLFHAYITLIYTISTHTGATAGTGGTTASFTLVLMHFHPEMRAKWDEMPSNSVVLYLIWITVSRLIVVSRPCFTVRQCCCVPDVLVVRVVDGTWGTHQLIWVKVVCSSKSHFSIVLLPVSWCRRQRAIPASLFSLLLSLYPLFIHRFPIKIVN